MALLGNILWFVFGGWYLFLGYAIGAVIFFPAFIPLFRLAVYSAWPFGRSVVTKSQIEQYREVSGTAIEVSVGEKSLQSISSVINVIWLLTFGWVLALSHLFLSVINLLLFWMIVTIPSIAGHWKLMPVALMPFNKVIVPNEVERDIKLALSRSKLKI